MISEPQRTYVLELLKALGAAADGFVVAGAQALKFLLSQARATKDIDFVLDVIALRDEKGSISQTLNDLKYRAVPGSQNFQFEKSVPGSKGVMRIEFMAPEELKRAKDFRVDVQNGIHARACIGGSIALAESSIYELSLPHAFRIQYLERDGIGVRSSDRGVKNPVAQDGLILDTEVVHPLLCV